MEVILSTTQNLEEAKTIADFIVKNHLAACVNIIPTVLSVYEWENEIKNDNEALMIIKTSKEQIESVIKKIKELHSYSVPEIICLDVTDGNQDYINWVLKQSK